MKRMNQLLFALFVAILVVMARNPVSAQTMQNYTAYPPFMNQTVPPLVMLVMDKDHRQFLRAYNDITDMDGDGVIDTTYKDTIAYDGYFDWTKCYTYVGANNRFEPAALATGANGHYCAGQWSGNFLNWATMARIDVLRKVLYGGHRIVDAAAIGTTASDATVLSRTLLPQDAHSWAKAYTGADIGQLTPNAWASITFCNTNTLGTQTSSLVMIANGSYPYAASTENKQCVYQSNTSSSSPYGPAYVPTYTYNTDVLVCVPSMLEPTCQTYTDTSSVNHYKPVGLMQSMGVDRNGTATTTDDVIHMKFALISGSYGAHTSGGVLRSNVVDVNSEIDPVTGKILAASQIIANLERFKIVQYSYTSGWYNGTATATSNVVNDNCNMGEILDLSTAASGICRSWGNPMAEMMYEAIRYFMGKTGPTTQFQPGSPDNGLLGLTVASSWQDPYATCPYCSKPFMLLLSDPRPSYDSDELSGSAWPKSISTSGDISTTVQTMMANAKIDSLEGIGTVLIGQSGAVTDNNCTPKVGSFASIRGLCIEEPTKQGSYYLAGLANYAKTTDLRPDKPIAQSITTYSVVTNPPYPTLTFQVGTNQVQIIPDFHDGCPTTPWGNLCGSQGANGDNSGGELVDFKVCPNDLDWSGPAGEQTVNGFTSCYDLMWDDADYGWDYELDVRYRIYVKTTTTQITVKTKGLYGAAGHTDYAGYFINGVTGAGQYLDLVCGGQAGFSDCDIYTAVNTTSDGMGNSVNTRTFTASGSTAQVLRDPFWYASKYGGFKDQNGSKTPDLAQEWDQDGNGVPDTYFFTSNPLQLQAQLGGAFVSILNSSGSGTAISVLANSASGDGAMYESFFFPSVLEPATLNEVDWVGYTQGLFIDTYGNIREDTDKDGGLTYKNDLIVQTFYDSNPASLTYGQTLVNKFSDAADGDGLADSTIPVQTNVPLTNVVPIWEAGKQLALMPPAARNIQTWVDSNNNGLVDPGEQIAFTTANDSILSPYLRTGSTAPYTAADNIINFIRGTQVAGMRDRQRTVNGSLQVWKLGDNIYSTPTVVGPPKERFDILYGDSSYTAFYQNNLTRRQVIYMGANDGMLHAMNAGYYHTGDNPNTGTLAAPLVEHGYFTTNPTDNSGGTPLGNELWGFIPYQLLPQLQWLTQVGYTHVYYVDLKPKVTDVRIFCDPGNPSSSCLPGQATSHKNGWGTILIGGFRMGGSCGACTAASGAPPMTVTDNFGSGVQTRTFYSAYFVLDITNPEVPPKLLWVFSDPTLGLTTGYPAVLRVNPPAPTLNTDNTQAKWFAVFGSGLTGYDGSIAQKANLWAIDLAAGPGVQTAGVYAGANKMPIVSQTTGAASTLNSWMGDIISLDKDLDWRADAVYSGGTINDGVTPWRGKMYRLTITGCSLGSCTPATWGITNAGGTQSPTEVLDTFPKPTFPNKPGPITSAPTITLDDGGKVWLFFGTGRYYNQTDKTDMTVQYLFGVKDSVVGSSCAQIFASTYNCWNNDLVDVSNATICTNCGGAGAVTGVTGVSTGFSGPATTTLQGLVASKDGWFTALLTPAGLAAGERSISPPTLTGGTVFFPTFIPSTDICIAAGTSNLYALYYLTGTAYTTPMIGSGASGVSLKSISLGYGLASATAIQTVSQGTGTTGAGGASGCAGRTGLYNMGSTSVTTSTCANTAQKNWSRYVSWINQRD